MVDAEAKTETIAVEAQGVGLRFAGGLEALREVNVAIRAGEFVSLVGPSGCGKSTFLRAVAGLAQNTAGTLRIHGVTPLDARRRQGSLSLVFQDATLLPWRSVRANVRLPLELTHSGASAHARVAEALSLVRLEGFEQASPGQLSGGMRMRVALARALVTQPRLLLLDEPFAALDDITRHALNRELLDLWTMHGWTALFVTHNVAEAVFLSNRVLIMSGRPGTIIDEIAVPFAHPRTDALRVDPHFAALTGRVSAALAKGSV